jgi:HK97 family phage portal protein
VANPLYAVRDAAREWRKRWSTHRYNARSRRSAYSLQPGYIPSLTSLAGVAVTPESALTFTAAFAAINVLSTDLASLPVGVYRRRDDGTEVPAFDHPAHKRLHRNPNDEQNAFRFRQHLWGHTHGWGNGMAEIVRGGDGELEALYPLNPRTTRIRRKPGRDGTPDRGPLYYEIDDGRKNLAAENVLHVAGLGFDGLQGYCPATLAKEAVGLGLGAEQFGATFFGNGAKPGGVLEVPNRLSETAQRNLRESFERVHQGGPNAHRVAVLEQGVTWKDTQIPPDAAQFLATRQFQVIEIARMWRVPPHKLGDYSQAHLANLEESNLDYLQTTLLGWVVAFEAEANWKLFSEEEQDAGYFVKHDLTHLMRGNMQARVSYFQGMRNMGVMSANDIATREGMNPIPAAEGGDKRIVQGQYVELSQVGEVGATEPGTPPPGPKTLPSDPDAAAEPDAGDDEP